MKRRDFITLLGGAAPAWPVAARAQQRSSLQRSSYFHSRGCGAAYVADFAVARAAYRAACRRWPEVKITLRQGARVVERNWSTSEAAN